MDREQALNRVVELAMKWQDTSLWSVMFKAGSRVREYQQKAEDDVADVFAGLQRGMQREELNPLSSRAEGNAEVANIYRTKVIDAHSEFNEMKTLVRQHVPTMLEFMPEVNFFDPDASVDLSHKIRDLKKLEGLLRTEPNEPPSPPPTSDLPFGLRWCEIPQTVLRDGYANHVQISNPVEWKLFTALVDAHPHAISEPTLKHLFKSSENSSHDRKNAPKRLREKLIAIGLDCESWLLVVWNGNR